jgi:hypothetical protein
MVTAPVYALKSILRQAEATFMLTFLLTAKFELASKKTSSATVGKEAPLAPPDVADQFPVLFQF